MRNYPYLIASLPEIVLDFERSNYDVNAILEQIYINIPPKDKRFIDWLIFGLKGENLTNHFYREVMHTKNRFLNEYFKYDLDLRNIQAAFLSRRSSIDAGQFLIGDSPLTEALRTSKAADFGASEFFEDLTKLMTVLSGSNILEREQNIDMLRWKKANEINTFNYFDIDYLLGFILKLLIINRWDTLDKKRGALLFKELVEDVRGSYRKEKEEESEKETNN